jgi:hypothetical protein
MVLMYASLEVNDVRSVFVAVKNENNPNPMNQCVDSF